MKFDNFYIVKFLYKIFLTMKFELFITMKFENCFTMKFL